MDKNYKRYVFIKKSANIQRRYCYVALLYQNGAAENVEKETNFEPFHEKIQILLQLCYQNRTRSTFVLINHCMSAEHDVLPRCSFFILLEIIFVMWKNP